MSQPSPGARPVVALVGRPNVGKSTLFNRLAKKRTALVHDLPGVTRDRNYAEAHHDGRLLLLVDTGGFEPDSTDPLLQLVRRQAQVAIDEASVVLFVVDGFAGITKVDQELAKLLRKSGKTVLLAVNKIDGSKREDEHLHDWHRLGFPQTFPVSAEHGRGCEGLLDAVIEALPDAPREATEEEEAEAEERALSRKEAGEAPDRAIRVAILGRPNVGKSTLVNALLGEERLVVSPVAGTTRDSVDTELEHDGRKFVLTDTAGIRKKSSIALQIEGYSVMRALRAAEEADLTVLLLDATEFAVEQDSKIAGLVIERGRPILVAINKWDLIEGDAAKRTSFIEDLRWKLPWIAFAPVVFLSAMKGQGVRKVLFEAARLFDQSGARVPTPLLNKVLREVQDHHGLPTVDGHRARIYYVAQSSIRPPTFTVQTNRPDLIPDDFRRYVGNRLRDLFGLEVPLRMIFVKKKSLHAHGAIGKKPGVQRSRKPRNKGRTPRRG